MGCGNNKVSRDYLTSQPVSTPSPRAAKATAASLGNQVLRVISQVSQESADRAAQARADAGRESQAAQSADAKREADHKAAEEKAEAKKAKKEAREQREHERLRDDLAYQSAAFAPNQPITYTDGRGNERTAWHNGVKTHNGGFQYMTRADGKTTTEQVHVSTIAKPNGSFDIHLTDRVNGTGRVETFDLTGAEAADDLFIAACQEFLYDMMRDLEANE